MAPFMVIADTDQTKTRRLFRAKLDCRAESRFRDWKIFIWQRNYFMKASLGRIRYQALKICRFNRGRQAANVNVAALGRTSGRERLPLFFAAARQSQS